MTRTQYDLEDRLIAFAVTILDLVEQLPRSKGAQILATQLCRSGTSPALNYGEAQAAESDRDFLHKFKVCLKELRESQICLKIIARKPYLPEDIVSPALLESSELVAMFTAGTKKKERNMPSR